MNLNSYNYKTDKTFQSYEFESKGPKGIVKKIVSYTSIGTVNSTDKVYNLGFGDLDEETGEISDISTADNKDRDIILATVAQTVIDFSLHHGNHYIFVEGNTPVKTRLYQIGVSGIWDEIKDDFELYGLKDDEWMAFTKNVNYNAFLIRKK